MVHAGVSWAWCIIPCIWCYHGSWRCVLFVVGVDCGQLCNLCACGPSTFGVFQSFPPWSLGLTQIHFTKLFACDFVYNATLFPGMQVSLRRTKAFFMVYPGLENKLIILCLVQARLSRSVTSLSRKTTNPRGAFPCAPCWSVCPSSLPSFLQPTPT
jgi:hypothetical protein